MSTGITGLVRSSRASHGAQPQLHTRIEPVSGYAPSHHYSAPPAPPPPPPQPQHVPVPHAAVPQQAMLTQPTSAPIHPSQVQQQVHYAPDHTGGQAYAGDGGAHSPLASVNGDLESDPSVMSIIAKEAESGAVKSHRAGQTGLDGNAVASLEQQQVQSKSKGRGMVVNGAVSILVGLLAYNLPFYWSAYAKVVADKGGKYDEFKNRSYAVGLATALFFLLEIAN